ncbi:MAG: methylenetetrahydrofolate--tRNA-(uracil(54)-C(5))-methyltransferase (FADH(2)-oxidizing) TrmFO [Oscillospiraceae bacterium]|nr:methylenetetrahydrofolate--tRNA-(uracil(54)-C(5))-methyltransferase (FADH(2)-oxidizing) TrmFO [Oscillospiraceae bacterium]
MEQANGKVFVASKKATIIGAGLAGCECALQLAHNGFEVTLYEQKPAVFSTAHTNPNFAELVCSNSLGRYEENTANGMLIKECLKYNSHLLRIAQKCDMSNKTHLNVDRTRFSEMVTKEIEDNPNIEIILSSVDRLPRCENLIVATGPLTGGAFYDDLCKKIGADMIALSDATSPIISAESVDKSAFQVDTNGDLLLPLTDVEFEDLVKMLVSARTIEHHGELPDLGIIQCIPIENVAKTDIGHLQNVRLANKTIRLRCENLGQSAYSVVGFMTHISQGGQRSIIRALRGLENAKFIRYGRVHRNTFVNAPKVMDKHFSTKDRMYIIGQLSGVDCYVPVISTGIIASRAVIERAQGKTPDLFAQGTMIRGFQDYITTPSQNFSPMVADFALIKKA